MRFYIHSHTSPFLPPDRRSITIFFQRHFLHRQNLTPLPLNTNLDTLYIKLDRSADRPSIHLASADSRTQSGRSSMLDGLLFVERFGMVAEVTVGDAFSKIFQGTDFFKSR